MDVLGLDDAIDHFIARVPEIVKAFQTALTDTGETVMAHLQERGQAVIDYAAGYEVTITVRLTRQ